METITVSWSELKNFIQNKNTSLQYVTVQNSYIINAAEGPVVVQAIIPITDPASSDQTDFEDNYQATANRNLNHPWLIGRIVEFAENGGSSDLRVNGASTPVNFRIDALEDRERFISSLRFEALGTGIQFTNFLSKSGALTNGVLLTIRSNDSETAFPVFKTTEDFLALFARGPSDSDFYDTGGTDFFRATLTFPVPLQLYKQGTFATDDFIQITIQDDLTSGLTRFRFMGFGFERES